ncbi:MAG TPA: hypothetical protein VN436_07350 [Holophaga sp.]|nr:hypothetical protein [Holophaga sp.]
MNLSCEHNEDLTVTIHDGDGGPDVRVSLVSVMQALSNHNDALNSESLEALYREHLDKPAPEVDEPKAPGEAKSPAPNATTLQPVKIVVMSDRDANHTAVMMGDQPMPYVKALDWHIEAGGVGMLHLEVILPKVELLVQPEDAILHLPLPGGEMKVSVARLCEIRDILAAQKVDPTVMLPEKWAAHDC